MTKNDRSSAYCYYCLQPGEFVNKEHPEFYHNNDLQTLTTIRIDTSMKFYKELTYQLVHTNSITTHQEYFSCPTFWALGTPTLNKLLRITNKNWVYVEGLF